LSKTGKTVVKAVAKWESQHYLTCRKQFHVLIFACIGEVLINKTRLNIPLLIEVSVQSKGVLMVSIVHLILLIIRWMLELFWRYNLWHYFYSIALQKTCIILNLLIPTNSRIRCTHIIICMLWFYHIIMIMW
jgi:hypothetical protein